MIALFKRKLKLYGEVAPLTVDMHSHLLPGLDDGVDSYEESLGILREMEALGYQKVITTPHIMGDYYKNSPETILPVLEELRKRAKAAGIGLQLAAAAEYYLDEVFMRRLAEQEPLLNFGEKRYVLFETSYMNASPFLHEAIFEMRAQGYTPILAHPERYLYLYDRYQEIHQVVEQGALLQVNANSIIGYYSKAAQQFAERLIDDGLVSFLATDCHNARHLARFKKARKQDYFFRALQQGVKNNSLL